MTRQLLYVYTWAASWPGVFPQLESSLVALLNQEVTKRLPSVAQWCLVLDTTWWKYIYTQHNTYLYILTAVDQEVLFCPISMSSWSSSSVGSVTRHRWPPPSSNNIYSIIETCPLSRNMQTQNTIITRRRTRDAHVDNTKSRMWIAQRHISVRRSYLQRQN